MKNYKAINIFALTSFRNLSSAQVYKQEKVTTKSKTTKILHRCTSLPVQCEVVILRCYRLHSVRKSAFEQKSKILTLFWTGYTRAHEHACACTHKDTLGARSHTHTHQKASVRSLANRKRQHLVTLRFSARAKLAYGLQAVIRKLCFPVKAFSQ